MKLSEYAKQKGISYLTAYRWFKAGNLQAEQMPSGTIIVNELVTSQIVSKAGEKVVVYARVSARENKGNLENQAIRVSQYAQARGWQVEKVVKEIGSGVNDCRSKLLKILEDPNVKVIVCEHKERLMRFGFNYLERLLQLQGRRIEVVNLAEEGKEDLMQDFVSIITSFCARLYGQRRSKRKTEKIIEELKKCS
jgi:putative resolvase